MFRANVIISQGAIYVFERNKTYTNKSYITLSVLIVGLMLIFTIIFYIL